MSDICARLRAMAGPIVPNVCTEAADEIERLRGGGCARDQRTTQYCAEAVRLQAERDEARRQFCELKSADYGDAYLHDDIGEIPRKIASGFGWDCFKEDGK